MKFLLLCTLCLAPAAAQAAPAFLPLEDVSVAYELATPGNASQSYRLDYDAAGRLARIESPSQGVFMLVNLPQGQALVVVPALHAVVQAPDLSALVQMFNSADGARFTPLGPGEYAGLACETYLVLNAQGAGTACLTASGVILHFSGHDAQGAAEVTALSVAFTAQPAQDFVPPDGFSNITLPPGALEALLQPQ